MINKTYLHPIRPTDYSNSVQSCHVMMIYCLAPSQKNSPHSKLKHPSRNIFQLLLLSSGTFYSPHPTVLKIFKLLSTGDKKNSVNIVFFSKTF